MNSRYFNFSLFCLQFIEQKENIVFIGTPGVGKTHLATSIGIEAAKSRIITYFISCNDLVMQLKRALLENRLEQRLKFFSKYKLLIIDEVGFLPLDKESSNLFFQLISKRSNIFYCNYYNFLFIGYNNTVKTLRKRKKTAENVDICFKV